MKLGNQPKEWGFTRENVTAPRGRVADKRSSLDFE